MNHFIEAGQVGRALEIAASAKQWRKVTSIIESMGDSAAAQPYFGPLAQHFEQVNDIAEAAKYNLLAGNVHAAIDAYLKRNQWDEAYRIASENLKPGEVKALITERAKEMEKTSKL